MRYETMVNIAVDGIGRDLMIGIDYEVEDGAVREINTQFKPGPDWERWWDATWFWDICPEQVGRRLDKQMVAEWNRAHGLTLVVVRPVRTDNAVSNFEGGAYADPAI
jgi:hypothetical protein